MNRRMVLSVLGKLMLCEAGLMFLPLAVSLIYKESVRSLLSFVIPIGVLAIAGGILSATHVRTKVLFSRDGYLIVSLGWVVLSLAGAVPFVINGAIPNYIDAVFESVSGFTTTGASILPAVEVLDRSVLFWRSFTHWVGGMGVLVFIMAVLPLAGGSGNLQLMKAESPGPDVGKLVPKSNLTARILYGLYFVLTVAEIIFLLCGGMEPFDALTISFGTAGTGGFGIMNDSCASYSAYIQIVITVFMALFGVNFNIYFMLICGKFRSALKSEELRGYLIIMGGAVAIITTDIFRIYDNLGTALRLAAFQVSSVMTTTGFTTADYDAWPEISRTVLILVMCVGACAGSTGGGFKVSRIVILLKNARKEIKGMLHPRNVSVVTFDGKRMNSSVVHSTQVYFLFYVIIFVTSWFLISFDEMDTVTNLTAVAATFNNIGPGLGIVGPTGNFADYSYFSKIILILDMLLGRLEIYPMLMLFIPANLKLPKPVRKKEYDE